MYTSTIAALPLLVLGAHATNHIVKVGANGLKFEPSTLTAKKGDTIAFRIYQGHNVMQSSFGNPCRYGSGNFSSGGEYEKSGFNPEFFVVDVKSDTDPIWAYCGAERHCELGMVFAANAPSSGNTFSAYEKAAAKVSSSSDNDDVVGGKYERVVGSAASSSSSSSSSASSSSSSSKAAASSSSKSASSKSGSRTTTTSTSGSDASGSSSTSTTTNGAPTNVAAAGGAVMAIAGFAAYLL